jgi:hypothetical protein
MLLTAISLISYFPHPFHQAIALASQKTTSMEYLSIRDSISKPHFGIRWIANSKSSQHLFHPQYPTKFPFVPVSNPQQAVIQSGASINLPDSPFPSSLLFTPPLLNK